MKEIDQLTRAKNILTSVLSTAVHNMGEKQVVQEAKNHIKTAIRKLEAVEQKSQARKQNMYNEYKQWWADTTESIQVGPMTPQVAKTVLGNLNAMINEEKKKLAELEKQSQQISDGDGEGKLLTN